MKPIQIGEADLIYILKITFQYQAYTRFGDNFNIKIKQLLQNVKAEILVILASPSTFFAWKPVLDFGIYKN